MPSSTMACGDARKEFTLLLGSSRKKIFVVALCRIAFEDGASSVFNLLLIPCRKVFCSLLSCFDYRSGRKCDEF